MDSPTFILPEAMTLEAIRATRVVRATDRIISTLLWRNPDPSATGELFVFVPEVTPEYLEPLEQRLADCMARADAARA